MIEVYKEPKNILDIVDIFDSLPGIDVSCFSGVGGSTMIFFSVEKNNNKGLFFLTRCTDKRYWTYGDNWLIELSVGDKFDNDNLPITYLFHSECVNKYDEFFQLVDLVKNMNNHLNHKHFLVYYNINREKFKFNYIKNIRQKKLESLKKII